MTRRIISLATCIVFSHLGKCWANSDYESVFSNISDATLAEDGKLNFTQLATKYGHGAEQYDVTTEDGYILTMFCLGDKNGTSVLLFHGIADASDAFIIRGNISLAITLANAGYRVWVGNNRGNKFGRRHVKLNPDTDKKFWDYSFHEIGYYDLAATIDFIREKTGEDNIATIGHSQGTSAHYVLGSLRPEYNERIKVTISLAPVAFLNNLVPPVSLVAVAGPAIALLLKSLGIEELLQDHKAVSNLITLVCSKGLLSYIVCGYGALFPFYGFDPSNIESEFLRVIFGHYPAATSRKSLVHFDQMILGKRFSQYDYGLAQNLVKYGTVNPPDYDLSAVTMKVALLVGKNDQLSKVEDVKQLRDSLPNVVHHEVLEPELWSHLDFVWAKNMPKYLYPSLFQILKKRI